MMAFGLVDGLVLENSSAKVQMSFVFSETFPVHGERKRSWSSSATKPAGWTVFF